MSFVFLSIKCNTIHTRASRHIEVNRNRCILILERHKRKLSFRHACSIHQLQPQLSAIHGRRNNFFQLWATVEFSRDGQKDISRRTTVVKFHF